MFRFLLALTHALLAVLRSRVDLAIENAALRQFLADYVAYYNIDRCHLTLDKDAPEPRKGRRRPSAAVQVVALPRVGGIHHRYE